MVQQEVVDEMFRPVEEYAQAFADFKEPVSCVASVPLKFDFF